MAQTAQHLYSTYQDRIYQIRLIELASGTKASIGSGFQVSEAGLLATNYHVISGAIYDPDKYRIEFIDHQGERGDLEVVDIDVIHDLALVRHSDPHRKAFLPMSTLPVSQGEEVYSIGNPRDLGMTVVKGTYNGLLEHSFYDRILFSGSINPGMSGGPALNDRGEVIGINVATAGNQLSFLVPVAELRVLLQKKRSAEQQTLAFKERIYQQLLQNQENQLTELLSSEWPSKTIGDATVAGDMASFTRCWGGSNDKERTRQEKPARYALYYSQCNSEDRLYLTPDFSTGMVSYEFYWLEALKAVEASELNIWQFYSRYQASFVGMDPGNPATEEHVDNFVCHSDFVEASLEDKGARNPVWKAVVCARQYKDYPKIYDLMFLAASVADEKKGLISHFALAGVDKKMGMQFVKRFMEHIQWKSL